MQVDGLLLSTEGLLLVPGVLHGASPAEHYDQSGPAERLR